MEKTKKNIEMNLRIGNKIKRIIKYETYMHGMEREGDCLFGSSLFTIVQRVSSVSSPSLVFFFNFISNSF
jgi:hypothetical protein